MAANLCHEHALKPRNLRQQQLDLVRHKTGYVWCARGEYGWPHRQRTDDSYKIKLFTNCLSRQLRYALRVFPFHSEDGCIFLCDLLAFANSTGFLNDRKNTLHPFSTGMPLDFVLTTKMLYDAMLPKITTEKDGSDCCGGSETLLLS